MIKMLLLASIVALIGCANSSNGGMGVTGPAGQNGKNGQNGTSLVAKTISALSSQCSDGGSVTLIAQDTLNTGVWDSSDIQESTFVTCNGLNGVNGSNGTSVTMIQFCPKYTGSYSGTFPEFGIVVSGKIFAVYWDGKNAWMAELYPGYYASTSTSALCNFTVNSNGTISN